MYNTVNNETLTVNNEIYIYIYKNVNKLVYVIIKECYLYGCLLLEKYE